MMTCKHVSTLISMGDMEKASLRQRMGVWMHLVMCRHCRAFQRQVVRIGRAALALAAAFEREPSARFESKLLDHLRS